MTVIQIARLFLLAIWCYFFMWLFTFGRQDLARLLHPNLWWLVASGGTILFLFLIATSFPQRNRDTNKSLYMKLTSLLVLLIPILFFQHVRTGRFNESTLMSRTVDSDAMLRMQRFEETVAREIAEDMGEGETPFTHLYFQSEEYENKEVEVVCQTFVDDKLPENTVMCYRFLVTCCAADAQPIFVFINTENMEPVAGEKWVKVQGNVSLVGEKKKNAVSIRPTSFEYVGEPAYPYAY